MFVKRLVGVDLHAALENIPVQHLILMLLSSFLEHMAHKALTVVLVTCSLFVF